MKRFVAVGITMLALVSVTTVMRGGCRTNAWYAQQKMNRFWAMDWLLLAFEGYSDAHGGRAPSSIEEGIAASQRLFSEDSIARDANTNRSLNRAVLLHDVEAHLPRRGKVRYQWLAIIFVPEDTLPNHPGYQKGEDCVYWVGVQSEGREKGQIGSGELASLTEARDILDPSVLAAARRQYDQDIRILATQPAK